MPNRMVPDHRSPANTFPVTVPGQVGRTLSSVPDEPRSAPTVPTRGGGRDAAPSDRSGAAPPVEPLDPPMVPFAVAGTVVWAVVGLVLLVFFGDWLAAHDREDWLWICLAGVLSGFVGLAVMLRHDAERRRRRAGR
jgi:Type II secretory pathway, component PulF